MFCKLWEHVEAPPSKRRRNEEAWSATSSCIWLDETTVPWSLLKAAISHYCPGTDKRRILGDSYRKFRGPPGTKTIFLLHIAIEGVLTRQKCAETPYATFWHPSLKDLAPQKAISSLFKLSGFSPSRNTSCFGLRSFYFVPGDTSSYFQIFPQRCAPENDRKPSFQKLIWCHMVPVGEKSDVNFWP